MSATGCYGGPPKSAREAYWAQGFLGRRNRFRCGKSDLMGLGACRKGELVSMKQSIHGAVDVTGWPSIGYESFMSPSSNAPEQNWRECSSLQYCANAAVNSLKINGAPVTRLLHYTGTAKEFRV